MLGTFEIMLGPFWDHCGISLGSCWDHFRIILGSCWDHFGTILESFLVHFVLIVKCFLHNFGIILGIILGAPVLVLNGGGGGRHPGRTVKFTRTERGRGLRPQD